MPRPSTFPRGPCFSLSAALSMLACGETVDIPQIEIGNDTVAETGFPVTDLGSGPLEPHECLTETKPGAYGIQYQCQGLIWLTLTWIYDEEEHSFEFPEYDLENDPPLLNAFGYYESYEAPYINACCGEFQGDMEDYEDFQSQPQFALSCIQDIRDQACISLQSALTKKINQLFNPFESNDERQAMIEVRDYLSIHSQECWSALGEYFPPLALNIYAGTWPIENDWADEDLADVTFEMSTILTGVYAPETGYKTCENLHGNDVTVIPLTWPGKFGDMLQLTLDEGDGSVEGPPYGVGLFVGNVTAAGDFESEMTSCTGPTCSRAGISMNELGDWAIDEMILNVDGNLVFNNGTLSETVPVARLELYGPAIGTAVSGIPPFPTEYTVPVGGANFLIVGKAAGDEEWVMLPVVNSTEITATESSGEWFFEPFEFEYTDDLNGLWTISVSETVWLED